MSKQDFCKIFESEKYGQILMVNDPNDEDGKPQVSLSFNCLSDFVVCSVNLKFHSFDDADSAFEKLDIEMAEYKVKEVVDSLEGDS